MGVLQSAKTACAAALENAEGVREALKTKDVLEAAQKSSTAAYRAHSVRMNFLDVVSLGNNNDKYKYWCL